MVATLWKPVRSLAPRMVAALQSSSGHLEQTQFASTSYLSVSRVGSCPWGRRPASRVAGGGDERPRGRTEGLQDDQHEVKIAHTRNEDHAVSGTRAKRKSLKMGEMREGALDRAHVCEALANARPSPFLPLFSPRQRGTKPDAGDMGAGKMSKPPPKSFFRRPLGMGSCLPAELPALRADLPLVLAGSDTVAFSSASFLASSLSLAVRAERRASKVVCFEVNALISA